MYIQLQLKSDLCASSGTGYAGSIDTDINFDNKTGLPYIQAKRLKGCLREAGLDILSAYEGDSKLEHYQKIFYDLFGKKGENESGKLKISNGQLNYRVGDSGKESILNELTSIRYGTKVEKKPSDLTFPINKVKDQSLRAVRVINREETFYFKVKFDKCQDYVDFFGDCCDMLRNMGINRTRGWGEVECKFIADGDFPIRYESGDVTANLNNFKFQPFYEQQTAHYKITLTEAVISSLLSGGIGCEAYLPGSMLLGCFAGLWIKANPDIKEQPHKNKEFRRIFLEGGVKFVCAYPGTDRPFYPAPASIKTNKTREIVHDDANKECHRIDEVAGKLSGFVQQNNNTLTIINPNFDMALHHARPYDRSIGHAKEGGNAEDGTFFSYKALSPGQAFYGSIIGSKDDLKVIKKLMPKIENVIHLGRSRSAQYGNASFSWQSCPGKEMESYAPTISEKKLRLIVRSPLILCDCKGTISLSPELIAKKLGMTLLQSFVSETLVAGYNSKWLLPRQQMSSIQAGSVIVLLNDKGKEVKQEQFIGLRTGEGFGQVFIEKLPENGKLPELKEANNFIKQYISKNGKELSLQIEQKNKKRNYEHQARNDKTINKDDAPSNAQLSRLTHVLHGKYEAINCKEELQTVLSNWKDEEKRNKIIAFCRFDNEINDWELYKAWLLTAINKVRLERRED